MSDQTVLQALMRKDLRLILPLILICLVGCLICNALMYSLWLYWDTYIGDQLGGAVTLWVLLPGLTAFGAAAMLIGTEEDSRTLSWLRTLPISWRKIANAKFLVGLGAYLVVLVIATVVLWLISLGWGDKSFHGFPEQPILGLLSAVLFQLVLLLLGFVMAYAIRSPIVSLLILIPAYTAVIAISIALATFTQWFFPFLRQNSSLSLGLCAVGVLILLWYAQSLLARRRLTRPLRTPRSSLRTSTDPAWGFRPPVIRIEPKPSPAISLLWQQVRQTAPLAVMMVVITAFMMAWYMWISGLQQRGEVLGSFAWFGFFGPLFMVMTASWLGVMTFYGDNLNGRRAFFADRGIPPTMIWWTRILPTLIGSLCLAGIILVLTQGAYMLRGPSYGDLWPASWFLVGMASVLFAFGQLVSQWMERPILAFLAAPAITFICLVPFLYFADGRNHYLYSIAAMPPILLFASWRLSRRWLEGRRAFAYTAQVIAYTVVAIAAPFVLIGSGILWQVARSM